MPKKIRAGIAGAGFIGAVHARAYLLVPDVELVGIADPIAEKVQPLARETGSRAFRDYEELLKANVDVLDVCLPPQLHLPAAEAAAQAGVHVLMEKPITRTLAEADQMIEARDMVAAGRIGRPLIVHDAMSITDSFAQPWYCDREIAGGGVFRCNAVHGLDRASWAIQQKVIAVSAMIEPTTGRTTENYGAAITRFDGGAQGNFFQHWGPYRTVSCGLRSFGEQGMIQVRSWDSVELLIGETRTVKHFYKPDSGLAERTMVGMVAELTEMANSVREGRSLSVTGEDGRAALAAVQAIDHSAETGQWVGVV